MTGSQPAQPFSLGTHSARGLIYLFTGAGFTKIVGVVCQILLLYLLDKRDLGLVTLVGTITAFVQLMAQSGVIDVLIQRRAFRQWSIPGFWLQLVFGVLSCILMVLCAPIVARIYSSDPDTQKQLFWLMITSSLSPLPYALSVVPKAQLSHELRFRALASVNTADVVMQSVLMVFFAWLGFGAYSFVLPVPIGGFVLMVALWYWVRPAWSMRLYLNRWRYLIGDSTQAMLSEFGRLSVDQSDYIMLGVFHTAPGLVGIYANGFKLSIQMLRLLTVNMSTILIPTYAKLNDQPQKQYQGFLTAQRILALLGISGCLLQAAIAEPLAMLLFPPKWFPSILVMQILSIGMATRMTGGGAYALLRSQGRFKEIRNRVWLWATVQFATLGMVLACGGGIVGTSIVVSIVGTIAGLLMFYTAIRPFGGGWADVADVLVRPLVIGVISVGVAWLIALRMTSLFDGAWLYLMQLVEICVVTAILNCLMARIWMQPVWNDLWLRIRRMMPHRAAG